MARGVLPVAAVVEALPADRDARLARAGHAAEGEVLLPHEDGRLVVRPAAGPRIDEDHVAGLGLGVGLFDPRKRLARPDFQSGGRSEIQRGKCCEGKNRETTSGGQAGGNPSDQGKA